MSRDNMPVHYEEERTTQKEENTKHVPVLVPQRLVGVVDDLDKYCFYSLAYGDPNNRFKEKLQLRFSEDTSPCHTSFIALGTKIYMVGGFLCRLDTELERRAREVFIYDTVDSTYLPGPPLNVGKDKPILITLGTKIFAIASSSFQSYGCEVKVEVDIEVLDTHHLGSSPSYNWFALPKPPLPPVSHYSIQSYAATSTNVLISVEKVCSFSYDITQEDARWGFASRDLPFDGEAKFFDGLLFGFSRQQAEELDVHVYKFQKASAAVAVEDLDDFYFDEIAVYRLPSGPGVSIRCPCVFTFALLSEDTICVIKSRIDQDIELYLTTIDAYQISILEEQVGASHTGKSRTNREMEAKHLWHKCYRPQKSYINAWFFM